MQELTLDSLEEYSDALAELEQCRSRLAKERHLGISDFLFRGQASSDWKLETTLERFTSKNIKLTKYYGFAYAAKAKVETFTEKTWDIYNPREFEGWVNEQSHISFINMPGYEYFAYLRHHGYPSPLLDWTYSPYIALFFAFRDIKDSADQVSVYVYMEYAGHGKVGSNKDPFIQTFGPYATIHQRHFLQQSAYTVCTIKDENDFVLTSHEDADARNMVNQDLIWKFNFPANERDNILSSLNKMNINAYSLFLTVDSLMESTAISENRFK